MLLITYDEDLTESLSRLKLILLAQGYPKGPSIKYVRSKTRNFMCQVNLIAKDENTRLRNIRNEAQQRLSLSFFLFLCKKIVNLQKT